MGFDQEYANEWMERLPTEDLSYYPEDEFDSWDDVYSRELHDYEDDLEDRRF